MTKRDVGILACRILALYAWLQGILYLPAFFGLGDPLFDGRPWSNYEIFVQVTQSVPLFAYIAAGLFLWKWAGLIAAWIFGHDLQDHQFEPEDVPERVRAADLHVVAFSTLGLWILIDLIPRATAYAVQIVYTRTMVEMQEGHVFFTMAASVELLVRLILGAWLVFGARAFVKFLHRGSAKSGRDAQHT